MYKILHICKKFPYPVTDGETIAVRAMARPLASSGVELSLLAMNTSRHPYRAASDAWPEALAHYRTIRMVPVDNRITGWGAFKNLFSRDSYHISRFVSPLFAQELQEWLREEAFDVVILETLFLAPYIPFIRQVGHTRIILRLHNVESEIWERLAGNLPFGIKRWYLSYLAGKLKRFEIQALPLADVVLAITERDLAAFRQLGWKGRGTTFPVGMQVGDIPELGASTFAQPRIGFIGSMDWAPNLEGIRWFLSEVWPRVRGVIPEAQLEIAGRSMPDWLLKSEIPGVCVLGEVSSAVDFMLSNPIQVVPVRSGSGVRVKLLEALALGRAVVTTPLGLEGVPVAHDEEVLVAENPTAFAEQVVRLLTDAGLAVQLARQGRNRIRAVYEEKVLAEQFVHLLQEYFPPTVNG